MLCILAYQGTGGKFRSWDVFVSGTNLGTFIAIDVYLCFCINPWLTKLILQIGCPYHGELITNPENLNSDT